MSDVTKLLERLDAQSDPQTAEELLSAVYNELRIIAQAKMNEEKPGHTLQPTVLVHDAWEKLFPAGKPKHFSSSRVFYRTAAKAMRQLLVDHARKRNAKKRGSKVEMSETQFANLVQPETMVGTVFDFDEALDRYGKTYPDRVSLIELRYCVGVTVEQAAGLAKTSKSSAERILRHFHAWFKSKYTKDLKPGFALAEAI